ncbi:MAG: peptidoglycan-binding protein [Verrucomicrobiota bacterium]|nr:peptidoglycan-binding protein [Verrucomicrobiota bacterium]
MKKRFLISLAAIVCAGAVHAQGDPSIRSVQQTLKDQGFYYGEITGQKDADTTAAIRRYQIRNGLQINGELNAETQKSLGVRGATAAPTPAATPVRQATPRALAPTPPPAAPPADNAYDGDLRDDSGQQQDLGGRSFRQPPSPTNEYAPGPRGLAPEMSGLFDGTPYEVAPPDVQRRVVLAAQSTLLHEGLYRSGLDGVYGPGMQFALRAYQSRQGLQPNGRLDMETLAALGLLPGQQTRGFERRRVWRMPSMRAPTGERIYLPR